MLTQFYKEMQAWIDAGLPEVSFFSKSFGLCSNLRTYCWKQFEPCTSPDKHQECADKYQECAESYMFRLAPTRVCAHHTGKKFNYPIYRSVVEKVMRKML